MGFMPSVTSELQQVFVCQEFMATRSIQEGHSAVARGPSCVRLFQVPLRLSKATPTGLANNVTLAVRAGLAHAFKREMR